MYFYDNWWENSPTDDKEAAKMLIFNSDKKSYQVGETAKITFPSAHVAKALISLENVSEVIQHQWVNTQKGKTIVEIPITKKMTPNFFVNISLLQPHSKVENDLPIRLYGTIPIKVEDPNTRLEPVILMPKSVEPEKEFEIIVSEKQNKSMTYTLAIVEEGLLDLTRFKTPNPYNTFYAREALGVRTWDIYDDVIGAYSGSIDQVFAIGGDGTSSAAKNRKANRFKPVVKYLGPFTLNSGQRKHKVTLPNYIGAVRTMIVAGNGTKEAYGNAEKSVTVKKPLMVLATLPRKLSPGEQVTLPVTVFATDNQIKNVSVQLQLSDGIEILGKKEALLAFNKTGEQMAYFKLDVSKASGIKNINVIAKSGLKTAKYNVEIDVENPNPITSKLINKTIGSNEEITIDFNTFGVSGTNSAIVQIASVPPVNFDGRLEYLIQYPHGCVEQTTSSVFPQLYMNDLFDLSSKKKAQIERNIKKGVERLGHFQRPNGGMSYWIGETDSNDWGSSYAGHFMIEAEKKGYVLPFSFKSNWVRYQKEAARNWKPSYDGYSDLNQAYRLYTLALSGNPDLGAMNRLREYDRISNDAKWRLAAAYALVGQKQASRQLANTASIEFHNGSYSYSYGSVTRNKAMALETMLLLEDERTFDFAKSIAKNLSSNQWMSTQTTAYSLLSMGKMLVKNGGKSIQIEYNFKGKRDKITSSKTIVERTLQVTEGKNQIQLKNIEKNTVYVSVVNKGKLPLGNELPINRGFRAEVTYALPNGIPLDITKLEQGQDFMATVIVKNLKDESVKDIALTQIFPSGWEIVNTRFTDFGNTVTSKARYTDIRDDRVNFYFDLGRKGTGNGQKTFQVLLNASYLGKYYLPGLQVEAMYDNDYLVRTKGSWIEVKK
ncbi:alpha-2-macroglobulin family protein [Pseudotenacibaculum sp. MALMAid0570]|uniref:alpha-2-macroglobulin family protein n=1 Tax=Pseudotenacibaculum sp. MALMAid0570 TaxID=3143938 RepID=UPI0032DED7BC